MHRTSSVFSARIVVPLAGLAVIATLGAPPAPAGPAPSKHDDAVSTARQHDDTDMLGSDHRDRYSIRLERSGRSARDEIPPAEWAPCGAFDDKMKIVQRYFRKIVDRRQLGTKAYLNCGLRDANNEDNKFGYWHILDQHLSHWEAKAAYIGRNWRDLAGWALLWAVLDPDKVSRNPTRYCYSRKLFLVYDDEVVNTMQAIVWLGKTGRRVMTLYPQRGSRPCKGTNLLDG